MAHKGNLLFSIGEIHQAARTMKCYEFENWLFEKLDGTPPTIDKTERVSRSYIQVIEIDSKDL